MAETAAKPVKVKLSSKLMALLFHCSIISEWAQVSLESLANIYMSGIGEFERGFKISW